MATALVPPPQQFCVRWNSYQSNLQNAFPKLLTSEHFVDVTLACENEMLKCHKVVLSACSTYFEKLLLDNPCQHPIIFMKDMKFQEVQLLVDFMYKGEVNVTQDDLPSLLKSAEALQIRGLCGSDQLLNQQQFNFNNNNNSNNNNNNNSNNNINSNNSVKTTTPVTTSLSSSSSSTISSSSPSLSQTTTNQQQQQQQQQQSILTGTLTTGTTTLSSSSSSSSLTTPIQSITTGTTTTGTGTTQPQQPNRLSSTNYDNNDLISTTNKYNDNYIKKEEKSEGSSSYDYGSNNNPSSSSPEYDSNDHNRDEHEFKEEFLCEDDSYYEGDPDLMDTEFLDDNKLNVDDYTKTPEFAIANVSCQYDGTSGSAASNRRIRRSDEELRRAAECITRGQTFQTVSDQFNIPISTIRFYMARKGILPRRKRGRACSGPTYQVPSTHQQSNYNNSGNTSPIGPPYHIVHYKLPQLGVSKLK